jgi:hypothetical protein
MLFGQNFIKKCDRNIMINNIPGLGFQYLKTDEIRCDQKCVAKSETRGWKLFYIKEARGQNCK